ncbi:hypothetical protein DFH09DRAFT_1087509 [Mycena vulgaris]|nr:hypothetical protein DFH09DRAFT_1087509 [Mycena vulgaris]
MERESKVQENEARREKRLRAVTFARLAGERDLALGLSVNWREKYTCPVCMGNELGASRHTYEAQVPKTLRDSITRTGSSKAPNCRQRSSREEGEHDEFGVDETKEEYTNGPGMCGTRECPGHAKFRGTFDKTAVMEESGAEKPRDRS